MNTALLISLGAILGALSRWQLGIWLNPLFSSMAVGTLVANLLGCFLIGIALGLNLSESHRLLFITGFLGSFTTFSAFSAEVSQALLQQKWLNALMVFSLHTFSGFMATLLGIGLMKWVASGRV